jgi:hypothetical protein
VRIHDGTIDVRALLKTLCPQVDARIRPVAIAEVRSNACRRRAADANSRDRRRQRQSDRNHPNVKA